LGTINATTSWSDVPVEIAETTARDNFLSGITFGFARGLAQGFTRTAAGLVDIATFPFPPYEEAMMEPEYKVSQPQKGYKVALLRW
jgi:putative exosortase-associated protein (TIGR04073 family)